MKEKMMSTAKKLDVFAAVIEKVLLVCGILLAILIVIVAVVTMTGSDIFIYSTGIQLGSVTLVLADETLPSDSILAFRMIAGLLAVVVIVFIARYIVKLLRSILSPVKEGRPFENQCSANLRSLAIVAWVAGGIWEIGRNVATYLIFKQISIELFFNMEKLSEIQYDYSIDIGFIIYGAILFLLSYVFRYGEILQKESDETL